MPLAAKAGASYVSPFVGRLDDIGHEGMESVQQIVEVFANYDFDCEVLVASVRGPNHLLHRQAGLQQRHLPRRRQLLRPPGRQGGSQVLKCIGREVPDAQPLGAIACSGRSLSYRSS